MYQSLENLSIERRFVTLTDRQVHYRISGEGPPLLLLHQSPTSSAEMATTIEYFADEFSVIAPDTPGFGLSDYRKGTPSDITIYAEMVKEFVDALGLSELCIYGFHTGAIIGAEMARLYPDLCKAVVVNGLWVADKDEVELILQHYTEWFEPTPNGSQMPWIWSRLRDQLIFFPWFLKEEKYRLSHDLPSPELKQPFVLDLLRTTEEAQTAYRAAFLYPSKERVQEINTPTFLLNYQGDPIGDHPQRLEITPDCVQIELLSDPQAVEARAREIFREFSLAKITIQPEAVVMPEKAVRLKGFVHTSFGPLFYCQEADQSDVSEETNRSVVFLHDFAASSNATIEIAKYCESVHRKIFIDLPGHGETGPTHLDDYQPQTMAKMLAEGLMQLNLGPVHLVSMGMSNSIAVALSQIDALQVQQLTLIDPWCPNASEMHAIRDHYAPDLTPSEYGEHLMRGWYFARDSELYFPWYDTKNANALKREPEIEPQKTHARAVDALKAGTELKRVAKDMIGYDVEANLRDISLNTKVYAWTGNGRENYAERIHRAISGSKLYYLPENRSQWSINLSE